MIYLCVDGGQTKTATYLLNEAGEILDSWLEGPLTTPSKPGAEKDLRKVVRRVAEGCGPRLTHAQSGPLEAACFSLTGYLEQDDAVPTVVQEELRKILPDLKRVHTIPDYVGNWAAVTRGEPGIMIISGGGSVVYGRDASGNSLRVGGWGHLLGDEGSGYWIGLETIKAALRSWSGVIPKTVLEDLIMEQFGTSNDLQLLGTVYSGDASDAQIAGLVPLVISSAAEGDRHSELILEGAAGHLADYCSAIVNQLGALPVHPSGGVFKARDMQERFVRLLGEAHHDVEVHFTSAEPSEGIFLIARGGILE